ncbi:hypothetical protein ACBJ59_29980 [Nonomuraea sp. MTCD27]|uniref:hypothetical protein n=1 Tax=Nonomuraea sp. MTCD27 TaxID=1676747 RepID=UPI0035C07AE5
MSPSGRRSLVAAVVVAAIMLTALSVHALWAPWSGGTRPASDSAPQGAVTLTGGTAHDVVTLTVSAPVTGVTPVHVRLVPREATVRSPPVVTVSAVLPTAGHAVPGLPAVRVSGDSYHVAGLPLMMAGRWEFLVAVDGDGRHERLVFPLTVSP